MGYFGHCWSLHDDIACWNTSGREESRGIRGWLNLSRSERCIDMEKGAVDMEFETCMYISPPFFDGKLLMWYLETSH